MIWIGSMWVSFVGTTLVVVIKEKKQSYVGKVIHENGTLHTNIETKPKAYLFLFLNPFFLDLNLENEESHWARLSPHAMAHVKTF